MLPAVAPVHWVCERGQLLKAHYLKKLTSIHPPEDQLLQLINGKLLILIWHAGEGAADVVADVGLVAQCWVQARKGRHCNAVDGLLGLLCMEREEGDRACALRPGQDELSLHH